MARRITKDTAIIGQNIRDLRRELGVSQQKLGELLGVSFQQMQKYEKGDNRFPSEKLYTMSQNFGIPMKAFFKNVTPQVSKTASGRVDQSKMPDSSSVFYTAVNLDDVLLKRKIEKIVEILLS